MKKLSAILLSLALLTGCIALPAQAADTGGRYYRQFLAQYNNGREPSELDAEWMVYEEVYYHETDGVTDWALIRADNGDHCEVLTLDIFFGRAFAGNDIASPFTYGYGIYDVAQERFFDFDEIADENAYPGLQDALDRFHVGQRIGTPQYGENLRYKTQALRAFPFFYAGHDFTEQVVKCYDELYYHETDGVTDWALVQGESWFCYPEGGTYEKIGDRVFKTEGIYEPFGNGYAVYDTAQNRFYELRGYLANNLRFPGLVQAVEALNLGEKIGDLDGDGKLTIKDATEMQRCLAELRDYPAADGVEAAGLQNRGADAVQYLSDVNRDGARTVADVTETQTILCSR